MGSYITVEEEKHNSREDVSLYMKRLEMRSQKTLGKSVEYLLAEAGGAVYVDDKLDSDYDHWRSDFPLEASIWDEIKSASRLPMTIHDWNSWRECYIHNHEILDRISFTFRKLDRHIKASIVKRTFVKLFEDVNLHDRQSYIMGWNIRKGFSTDSDSFDKLQLWLMKKASDKDVLSFNSWAAQMVPLWPQYLQDVIEELTLSVWWGRNKTMYPKSLASHFDKFDKYLEEIQNAIRIYALNSEETRSWFLRTFAKDGITEATLRFESFI